MPTRVRKGTSTRRDPLKLINLRPNVTPRKFSPAKKADFKAIGDLVAAEFKKPTFVGPYLVLSAANTKTNGKGYINAIGCRNMFADSPGIDFLPPENTFGGKIEIWMVDVNQGDSFTIQFRVICGYNGNWKISSSETAQFQTPITPVEQSIDFLIPPVTSSYGLVLITLEPLFQYTGSWVFQDAIIHKIQF